MAELGYAGARVWVPQPVEAQAFELGAAPPSALAPRGRGIEVELSPPGEEVLVGRLLQATREAWELELQAGAGNLAVSRAVHELSNALTPLLCAETAESLTEAERTRIQGRTATLRRLVRGSQGTLPLHADRFLNEIRAAVEEAGVEVRVGFGPGLEGIALAPDHELLRQRLIEILLAGWQAGTRTEPVDLGLSRWEDGLRLSLTTPARTLLPSWICEAVACERSSESLRLDLHLPRPWLAWVGPEPRDRAGLEALGLDLVVLADFPALEAVLARTRPALFPRPCGVALSCPTREHGQIRRQVMAIDLELGRATHSAATWPSQAGQERVDIGAWCRTAASSR